MLRRFAWAILIATSCAMPTQGAQARHPTPTKKAQPKRPAVKKPAPKVTLRGSGKVARRQNSVADAERLTRLRDEAQLRKFIESGLLVPIKQSVFVKVSSTLARQYHYCRPWTMAFLNDFGKARYLHNRRPIQVNSAVRPISRQLELKETNRNAAPVSGPYRSSHATASTVDIAKGDDLVWMRDYLRALKAKGKIEVVEEFSQLVFHVMVFQDYNKKPVSAKSKIASSKSTRTKPR